MRRFISIIIPCLIIGLAVLSGELGMKLPDGTTDACFSGFYFKGASWLTLLVEFSIAAQLPVFLFLIVTTFLAKEDLEQPVKLSSLAVQKRFSSGFIMFSTVFIASVILFVSIMFVETCHWISRLSFKND